MPLVLFYTVACSTAPSAPIDPVEQESEAIDTVYQDLYEGPGVLTWPSHHVYVCYNSGGTSMEAQWHQQALADSWGAATRLTFSYATTCPFPGQPHYVAITWSHSTTGWFGIGGSTAGPMGMHPSGSNGMVLAYCDDTDCLGPHFVDYQEVFKSVSVHEMGHALGFVHEQQRPDYTSMDCPADDGVSAPNDNTITGGTYLTPIKDKDSIMSYCRGYDGFLPLGYQEGYKGADRLSAGDVVGSQTAYGVKFAYWLDPGLSLLLR